MRIEEWPANAATFTRGAVALEHVEVLRDGLELPADAGAQDLERHAFDLGEVAHDPLAVGGAARRDGEAAVADHRGGDAERGEGDTPGSQVICAS